MISLEEQIKKQEETVLKVKEKYDSEKMKLKDLYAKRNEEKKKELLKAVENSTKTYEEIMAFICLNNPVPVSLLSGDRKPQIRFLGNHHSGSGNLYHKSFRM